MCTSGQTRAPRAATIILRDSCQLNISIVTVVLGSGRVPLQRLLEQSCDICSVDSVLLFDIFAQLCLPCCCLGLEEDCGFLCVLMNTFLSGTRCTSESSTYLSLRSLRPPCKSLFWARPGPAQQPRWQEMLLQPSMQHNVFFMRICCGASLPQAMAAHFAAPCCQQQKLNSHRF